MSALTREQYDFLVSPLNEKRIAHANGQSHLEQWDVRRHLIRCFGYGGYDVETKALELVREVEIPPKLPNDRPRWTVLYRAEVRLIVKAADGTVLARYEDGATGDAQNQPVLGDAHDLAMKTALSQALKRCAVNLGDQFGLSLYRDGSAAPVVSRSLIAPPEVPAEQPMVTQQQHRRMHALWRDLGFGGPEHREERLEQTAQIVGRPLESSAELTEVEAVEVIRQLVARADPAPKEAA